MIIHRHDHLMIIFDDDDDPGDIELMKLCLPP